jgi:hypothetical protein
MTTLNFCEHNGHLISADEDMPEDPSVYAAPDLPRIDLQQVVDDSGLVMVETARDKLQAWQTDEPALGEAPRGRRRRPPTVIADEPLVMVETRH